MYYEKKKNSKTSKKWLVAVIFAIVIVAAAALVLINMDSIKDYMGIESNATGAPGSKASLAPGETPSPEPAATPEPLPPIVEDEITIGTRFSVPAGYERVPVEEGSFAAYLRNYQLKPYGAVAKLADGSDNPDAPIAGVFNQDIRANGLQQCADAIIRLYAEYHYERGEYEEITFDLYTTPVFKMDFATWITGQRIRVNATTKQLEWYASESATPGDISYGTLRYYLDNVMNYANTYSLKTQMKSVNPRDLSIGDAFIITAKQTGGTEGHAILVVDMAVNKETGDKIFICAEGNTPATETYVIVNPETDSVWLHLEPDNSFIKGVNTYPPDSIRRFG